MEDKRNNPRIKTNVIVNCSRRRFNRNQQEDFHVGYTDNISLSGVKVVIPQEVETKDTVFLELKLDPHSQSVKAQAEVIWYKSMITWREELRGYTEAGLHFQEDSISNPQQLAQFLRLKTKK
jgi:hypothetical protein